MTPKRRVIPLPMAQKRPSVLLIGPYDPHCGEYTFLAPPLGVWRLKGVLAQAGVDAHVFDPNCCDGPPSEAFAEVLSRRRWDVVGSSTTGMTLRYDLSLAHQARRALPEAVLIAGGMEATFKPELMFELGPFDLVGLGEGERPLLELSSRIRLGGGIDGIAGTARPGQDGSIVRLHQNALDPDELEAAIYATPYEEMPYSLYWERLERAYRVGELSHKADREARLGEIRSVRLITLNYCPMGCTFCSSTNFLHAAQGSVARIRRLSADACMTMIRRIVATQPGVRTVIFQDDIFVFTKDDRILPLCEAIVRGKREGDVPADLQFISTNRIDAMNRERLEAMSDAGFRVLGFGIESFSVPILKEFRKDRIHPYIEPNLSTAIELGITPFLDLILTSPRCSLIDLADNLRNAFRWLRAGCELGMYPYVIPFSGAPMASDPELAPHTLTTERRVAGTDIVWQQPSKIPPIDPVVRSAILEMEVRFEAWLARLEEEVAHLPSRVRSLLWILCGIEVLGNRTGELPDAAEVVAELVPKLPGLGGSLRADLEAMAHPPARPSGPAREQLLAS